jgi:hypothetical protein
MNIAAKWFHWVLVVYFLFNLSPGSHAQASFVRAAYFQAFEQDNVQLIDNQLKATEQLSGSDRDAFEGALLMRKAGLLTAPVQKLTVFKQGAKKLEAAIEAQPKNAEYRFLRLMIQENAPKILGYNDKLKPDSRAINSQLQSLDPATRAAVRHYAAKSKYL